MAFTTIANPTMRDSRSLIPDSLIPIAPYACLYRPPAVIGRRFAMHARGSREEFSPRYERHRDDLVSIDVSGLERLLGPARTIGEELRRDAAARGMRVHVAVAAPDGGPVLALARPASPS